MAACRTVMHAMYIPALTQRIHAMSRRGLLKPIDLPWPVAQAQEDTAASACERFVLVLHDSSIRSILPCQVFGNAAHVARVLLLARATATSPLIALLYWCDIYVLLILYIPGMKIIESIQLVQLMHAIVR